MWANIYSLEEFGEFIRMSRQKKGLRQDEFARKMHTTHVTLSKLENGTPISSRYLMKALGYLNMQLVIVPRSAEIVVKELGDD